MNQNKIYNLQSYFKDQYQTGKITYCQFVSANFLLQIIHHEFPNLIAPLMKTEDGVFVFSWCKGKNYIDLGIGLDGLYRWKIYFVEELEGFLGHGKPYHEYKGNILPFPIIWSPNNKKDFEFFNEHEIEK
jgi:hypothetical protein